jgi:hypothetical protein
MKKIVCVLVCAALTVFSLSACVTVNYNPFTSTLTGVGARETYTIEVGGFTGIKVIAACEINYHASPSESVTLEIQPNLREHYTVEVRDGVLHIGTEKGVRINLGTSIPILTVYAPTLTGLDMAGAGTFTAHDTITADSFTMVVSGAASGEADLDVKDASVILSGAGTFNLTGRADTAQLRMSGAGSLDALGLITRVADVTMSGVGMVRIHCTDDLRIDAGGVGSVEYRGSPGININRSGMVSVKNVD